LGLGLALVKRLLALQGGEVSAYSAGLGKGSRFTIYLPRVPSTEAPSDSHNENVTLKHGPSKNILVVDDNKDAAETMQLLLEAAGHKVFVAHSAQDALALACETSPAVLCLDIGLPGMDGYELACQFRRLPATVHSVLVALTGYGQTEDKERARSAGFDHFLVKPVKLPDLLEVFSKAGH
jgi:CheY-like chemotaxis protein